MNLSTLEKRIVPYLKQLSPQVMGLASVNSIEILDMTPGAYNLNYHVRVDKKKFIFRINIEQQSGLSNQIEVEFNDGRKGVADLPLHAVSRANGA